MEILIGACFLGMWNDGNNESKGAPVIRTYYRLKAGGKSLQFGKRVYTLRDPEDSNEDFVLIHYVGDSKVYSPRAHGNSKSGRLFIRNSKCVRESIAEKAQSTKKGPEALFHDLDKELAANPAFYETHQSVFAPRDPKQCSNVKYIENIKRRILRCEVFSVVEMANLAYAV